MVCKSSTSVKMSRVGWMNLIPSQTENNREISQAASRDNLSLLQRMKVDRVFSTSNDYIRSVCWNETGNYILSTGSNGKLDLIFPFSSRKLQTIHGVGARISAAKFMPQSSSTKILSGDDSGMIIFTDAISRFSEVRFVPCTRFYKSGTSIEVIPGDPYCFLASSFADRRVRRFDLRQRDPENESIILDPTETPSRIAVNPVDTTYFAVSVVSPSRSGEVRVYDARMLNTRKRGQNGALLSRYIPNFEIFGLSFRPDGKELAVANAANGYTFVDVINHMVDSPNPKTLLFANPPSNELGPETAPPHKSLDTMEGDLPGPRQVITNPGRSGINHITGDRQRRVGVSGPPSGYTQRPEIEDEDPEVTLVEQKPSEPRKPEWRPVFQPLPRVTLRGLFQNTSDRGRPSNFAWWGNNYTMSPTYDHEHVFGWDIRTGIMCFTLCNNQKEPITFIDPNPIYPVIATVGGESRVSVWQPICENACVDQCTKFNPLAVFRSGLRNENVEMIPNDLSTIIGSIFLDAI